MIRKALFIVFLLLLAPIERANAMHIFACEPEWAALAKDIGGRHVTVFTASSPSQDTHTRTVNPGWILEMAQADLSFCTGAALESSWLPKLIKRAGKASLSQFYAADNVTLLSASEAEHPSGNPHIHLDPHTIIIVAKALVERLSALDPKNATFYRANYRSFAERWQRDINRWEKEAAPLKGAKFIVKHNAWPYLFQWLGLVQIASLEPVHDVPLSAKEFEHINAEVRKTHPRAIILAPFEDDRAAKRLVEQDKNLKIVRLPYTVNDKDTLTLEALFNQTITLLLKTR